MKTTSINLNNNIFLSTTAIRKFWDLSEESIKIAKQRLEIFNLDGIVEEANIENYSTQEKFDLVYSFGVLHHTPDTQKAIKNMQDPNSSVRFLVGTPQTGGYGITLTGASTMIYYSNGYDLEKRMQSEARIDRIGQEKPMTYIDIIAEKTVDEKIVKALRKKVNIATQVMGEELKDWI